MPAFTTNVEFGYYLCKNPRKVYYGRPDDSEKNKYLDWLFELETGMNRLCAVMPYPNMTKTPFIDQFIHSNTVDIWWKLKYKPVDIKTLDVSKIFDKAIKSIHNNESVSELFV